MIKSSWYSIFDFNITLLNAQIGEYAELGAVTREMVESQEVEFANEIKSRAEANGGKLTYQTCTKAQMEVAAEEILSQKKVVEGLKSKYPGLLQTILLLIALLSIIVGFQFHRIPVCNSGSPTDNDYDLLIGALTGSKFNAPVIINCQVGLSRSTTGGVIACLFREYQVRPDGTSRTLYHPSI